MDLLTAYTPATDAEHVTGKKLLSKKAVHLSDFTEDDILEYQNCKGREGIGVE